MGQGTIDKTFEIIVEQQAQFYSNQLDLQAGFKRLQKIQEKSEKRISNLEIVSANLVKVSKKN